MDRETHAAEVGGNPTRAIDQEFSFDGGELVVLTSEHVPLATATGDPHGLRVRLHGPSHARDLERDAKRLEAVRVSLTSDADASQAALGTSSAFDSAFTFQHVDTGPIVAQFLERTRATSCLKLRIENPDKGFARAASHGPTSRHTPLDWPSASLHLPEGVGLTIATGGPMSLDGAESDVEVFARRDASIAAVSGDLTALTGGATRIVDIEGDVRVFTRSASGCRIVESSDVWRMTRPGLQENRGTMTASGVALGVPPEMVVSNVRGALHANADWVTMRLETIQGDIYARNVRGDIHVVLDREDLESGKRIGLETEHGDIHVQLPAVDSTTVRLDTQYGPIQIKGKELNSLFRYAVGDHLPLFRGTAHRQGLTQPQLSVRSSAGGIYLTQRA